MAGIKDQKNIEALRQRLYERNFSEINSEKTKLANDPINVARGWDGINEKVVSPPKPEPEVVTSPPEATPLTIPPANQPKRSYRWIILLASVGIFLVVAIFSSFYLFFGANQISGRNISIALNAPVAVAAGDVVPLQVSISNQNSVAMESANLILNYPVGTKTNDEQGRDLFEERIPLSNIPPGEAINLPVSIVLFGEENQEKEIKAAIEYRVSGSNSTFFKEAEPIIVRINSSPLVIRATSLSKVSSGQEIEIKITVQSNASTIQRNLLVSAAYPNSFSFISSDPAPVYQKNEWVIKEIAPDSSQEITIRGRVSGVAGEQAELQLAVGTPRSDNQFMMGSVLSKAKTNYIIERPFIDVGVAINKDSDGSAVLGPGEEAEVVVSVKNTLNEAIYDMRVEVTPKGNLIRDNLVSVSGGLYDSQSGTIRWEVSGASNLAEIAPNSERQFTFRIKPDTNQTTAAFDISTKVFARRVNEPGASQEVVGTAVAEAKYSSTVMTRSQIGHGNGNFSDSGPIPPVVNRATTYTATFEVSSGVNDVNEAVLTMSLPQYVDWLDNYAGEGQVEFNPTNKEIRWNIGNLTAKTSTQLQVQLRLNPYQNQVGRSVELVSKQDLRAKDRFTNATLRAQAPVLRNELSTEFGFFEGNGNVQRAE
ncbi:MAG TPA: hypothetical protein PKA42_01320 [Candidatus Paceibacterota bacterium]|nr:hypothetical protein [Candidatus Paceibacterota bacterium]HMO82783.1 hypothetical protein [Candidatus Paceibacterota bacterium]